MWGERDAVGAPPRTRRGGRLAAGAPRPHPFALPADALEEALGGESGVSGTCTILLPTSRQAPLPSPGPLQVEVHEAGPDDEITLTPWTVPSLLLDPGEALDLLLDLDSVRGSRVHVGSSLAYSAELANYAIELVSRGRVLPTLCREGELFFARWRPVLTAAADLERRSLLERLMPPACRALAPGVPSSAVSNTPGTATDAAPAAAAVLGDALAILTDACARRAAGAVPVRGRGRVAAEVSARDAWLDALTAETGVVAGSATSLRRLAGELDAWTEGAGVGGADRPFRTCFRLNPPSDPDLESGRDPAAGFDAGALPDPGADARWRIDFLLQATDDPSLLVGADRVWQSNGGGLAVLDRRIDHPHEWLLADLGRARRLLPELEGPLRGPRPESLELDTAGAHRFLRESAPLLEQAGFGVLVPSWWTRPTARIGLRLGVRSRDEREPGGMGLGAICDFEWKLALGGETLTAAEFRTLAALKTPLIRLRGKWIELHADEVESALRMLERDASSGTMTAMEALRLSAGLTEGPAGLPVVEVTALSGSWLERLLSRDDGSPEPVRLPPGFRAVLRPYQERGVSWLAFLDRLGLGACLADDMGLGKTVQLLALLAAERAGSAGGAHGADGAPPPATLLVCPMSVVGNWQREAERFAPDLRVHVHHGGGRMAGEAFAASVRESDLVITTYGLAARDRDLLATIDWHRLVLDEAQNIKNDDSLQNRAIRSLPARGRVALTGTPVENRLSELRSLMEFLNPGLLGSAREFRTRFSIPIERFRDADSAQRLRRLTGPFLLRRLKTDPALVPDLPRKMEMKVFCTLTPEQASLYQAVVDDMLARIEQSEGIERKGLVLATMLKLKQVCNHPAHLLQDRSSVAGRSGKLTLLEELLEEAVTAGDRALVFTQFVELGGMLQPHLHDRLGREIAFLHGGTPRRQRDAMVRRFQDDDGPPVFLLSLKAGGTGLNLTAANQVIHFDRWWNPAVEDQATDRAFRIGQKRNVQVRKLVCAGTLEERIDAMIERKKELAERAVGAGESWLTELSTAELRDIVRLSTDAVAERGER